HRDDDNFGDLVEAISGTILRLATTSAEERKEAARKAKKLAAKADWVHFIKYYDEAYQFALQKTAKASRQS
ncbi:MAG: glycosyl transferase, partial [Alloprevotella tannerae]|nr:glycosyl transferase [Alloprevotella tannerae]